MVCSLCGREFPFHDEEICLKCHKLTATESEAEQSNIKVYTICGFDDETAYASRSGHTPVRRL